MLAEKKARVQKTVTMTPVIVTPMTTCVTSGVEGDDESLRSILKIITFLFIFSFLSNTYSNYSVLTMLMVTTMTVMMLMVVNGCDGVNARFDYLLICFLSKKND